MLLITTATVNPSFMGLEIFQRPQKVVFLPLSSNQQLAAQFVTHDDIGRQLLEQTITDFTEENPDHHIQFTHDGLAFPFTHDLFNYQRNKYNINRQKSEITQKT